MFLNIVMGFLVFCLDLHAYVFYTYQLILPLTFELSGQFPSNVTRSRTTELLKERERETLQTYSLIRKLIIFLLSSHQRIQIEQSEREIQNYLFSLANHVKNETV